MKKKRSIFLWLTAAVGVILMLQSWTNNSSQTNETKIIKTALINDQFLTIEDSIPGKNTIEKENQSSTDLAIKVKIANTAQASKPPLIFFSDETVKNESRELISIQEVTCPLLPEPGKSILVNNTVLVQGDGDGETLTVSNVAPTVTNKVSPDSVSNANTSPHTIPWVYCNPTETNTIDVPSDLASPSVYVKREKGPTASTLNIYSTVSIETHSESTHQPQIITYTKKSDNDTLYIIIHYRSKIKYKSNNLFFSVGIQANITQLKTFVLRDDPKTSRGTVTSIPPSTGYLDKRDIKEEDD